MTREELTHKWNGYKGIIIYPTDDVEELINATMEALEQEPKTDILDKIREEISEAMDMEPAWKGQDNYIGGLQIACPIIDKYKQEG